MVNESERQRLAIILNMADFTEFRLAAEEMDRWLNGIEQKLVEAAGDEDQVKVGELSGDWGCSTPQLIFQPLQLFSKITLGAGFSHSDQQIL